MCLRRSSLARACCQAAWTEDAVQWESQPRREAGLPRGSVQAARSSGTCGKDVRVGQGCPV